MLKTLHIPFVPINFVDVEMDYILKNLHSGNHVKRTILTTFLHGEEEAFTVNFFPLQEGKLQFQVRVIQSKLPDTVEGHEQGILDRNSALSINLKSKSRLAHYLLLNFQVQRKVS